MTDYELLSEVQFKARYLRWRHENDTGMIMPEQTSYEEYAEVYPMPDFDYVHTQSFADKNGDLITLLKGNVHLSGWMTRNHRDPRDFNFYLVLKTLTDSPEVEPFPMGYIVVS